MNDREMLELAAKACGIKYAHLRFDSGVSTTKEGYFTQWNPLNNDGDALRLAVKLNLNIDFLSLPEGPSVRCFGDYDGYPSSDSACCVEILSKHEGRDVRRAIVRAAAEIGRESP